MREIKKNYRLKVWWRLFFEKLRRNFGENNKSLQIFPSPSQTFMFRK